MTGRTHDLAAFTALNIIVISNPPNVLSLSTLLVSLGANLVGGLTPDIDQSTADLWHRLPVGSVIGKIISPLFGGHRFISHSLFGLAIFGFLSSYILDKAKDVFLINMDFVWFSFMIGVLSHLIMDTFTREGVPWLFPIPIRFGIPPFKFLRITTGGFIESFLIFPALLLANGYLFYNYYFIYLQLFKHL